MAVIEGGASAVLLDVGANTKAGRFEIRPTDVGSLGSYSLAQTSGTMSAGLGAASSIFACRWGDATRAMVVRRIGLVARDITTAFTAGTFLFELIAARSYTASDTGGTAATPTGNSQKRRTSFGTTLITDLRIASTAALGAGTRTLDAQPLNICRGFIAATAVNFPFVSRGGLNISGASTVTGALDWFDLWALDVSSEWPLILVQNEGFIIRATVPATGTWDFSVLLEWSEVSLTAGFN